MILNPDAYAYIVLQDEYRRNMDEHAMMQDRASDLRRQLERTEANAKTAAERATSIMETLLKLEPPRAAPPYGGVE